MFEFIGRWRLGKRYSYETLFKGQDTHPVGKPGVILYGALITEKKVAWRHQLRKFYAESIAELKQHSSPITTAMSQCPIRIGSSHWCARSTRGGRPASTRAAQWDRIGAT
jgi:hypothetical protein